MIDNNPYMMMNAAGFQEPQYAPASQVNDYYFSYNVSLNYNVYNEIISPFRSDDVPYEDNITDTLSVYEREVEDKSDDN